MAKSDNDGPNRTARGRPPAPFGTEDTLAAPVSLPAGVTPARTTSTAASTSSSAASPSSSVSLPVIDRQRYQLEAEVGRGGLGRVSKARDTYLDRPVAVKELLERDGQRDVDAQRRFVREALITARLQHPAIVPIYDAGQAGDAGPFYAMKLVDGKSLADALAGARTLDERLAFLPSVIAVVDAMAYAHSQGIIHRDLKPQNVLVGKYGETVLIDWGLAKDLNVKDTPSVGPYRDVAESSETLDGAVLGTPAFMAPEQAATGDTVDERADVYALGSMLYFLGAGVPPHLGKSVDEMLVKLVSGDIVPLEEREPRIPADLAAIVKKAMAHDPAKRYASARELSEDLHKFQTGKLVGAKTYTRTERLRRWVGKNKRLVAVTGVALAVLAAYGGWSLSRIYAERQRAEDEAARARAAADDAATQRDAAVAQAMLVRARQYAATGHAAEELAVLRVLARPEANASARRLAITEGGLVWKAHQRLAMALGRDVGLSMRSADGARFVATEPGAIVVWDVASGRELARHPIEPAHSAARFGKLLALSPTGRYALVPVCAQPGTPCGIVPSDDAFAVRPGTTLELRELATGRTAAAWEAKPGEPPLELRRRSLTFAYDDSAFAVLRGGRVQILEAPGATPREVSLDGCSGPIALAPAGAHLAIGCGDHVRLVAGTTPAKILAGGKPTSQLHFVAPDRLLALGERTLRLWDVARGELRGEGELPETPDGGELRDEGDDIEWSYLRPGAKAADVGTGVEHIRIGSSTSIVPRTSVLGPPPRIVPGGALVTLEGADWQALWIDHDRLRYALVDYLIPSVPPERCLPRIGSERHATIALDGGARLLVDEQELAAGLAVAPAEGYRHTTTDELPVRQLRPLVAAETDACLVWGGAVGPRTIDGGALVPGTRAVADGEGLLVIDHRATRISSTGARTEVPTPGATVANPPLESPTGAHVAAIDLDRNLLTVVDVATGKPARTWTATGAVTELRWVSPAVLQVTAAGTPVLVPVDAALPARPREPDLVTDPRSNLGVHRAGADLVVLEVATGKQLARHPTPGTAQPLPDDTGSIVVDDNTQRTILFGPGAGALANRRVVLAANRHARLGALEVAAGMLVSRTDESVAVWDLATGAAFAIPLGARDVAIRDGEVWAVTGGKKPRLVRTRLDGKGTREVRLSTAGLPLHDVRTDLQISADGTRLAATYGVTEELTAVGLWSVETGELLWVGPPASRIVGDWIVAGGRAFVPTFELDALLRDTGARTNLRVCQDDLRAVPVVPPPAPDTYWAPPAACATNGPR